MRLRVYIAGPYSSNPQANTEMIISVASNLIDLGFAPYVPHLTHFIEIRYSKPYEIWMEVDNPWLVMSQAVLRVAGESPGADEEIDLAERWSIPVFYSIGALMDWRAHSTMKWHYRSSRTNWTLCGKRITNKTNAFPRGAGRATCPDCLRWAEQFGWE